MKTLQAAARQIDDIIKIQKSGRFDSLEDKLKEVALLRIDFPDASLNELSDVYEEKTGTVMSKSGMKHRFNKLHEIAERIK
jgi:hypothetical protein